MARQRIVLLVEQPYYRGIQGGYSFLLLILDVFRCGLIHQAEHVVEKSLTSFETYPHSSFKREAKFTITAQLTPGALTNFSITFAASGNKAREGFCISSLEHSESCKRLILHNDRISLPPECRIYEVIHLHGSNSGLQLYGVKLVNVPSQNELRFCGKKTDKFPAPFRGLECVHVQDSSHVM